MLDRIAERIAHDERSENGTGDRSSIDQSRRDGRATINRWRGRDRTSHVRDLRATILGALTARDEWAVEVVASRMATDRGANVEQLFEDLVKHVSTNSAMRAVSEPPGPSGPSLTR